MRVSRKIRNLLRRERRANPSVEMRLAQGKAESPTKQQIRERAEALWLEYKSKGATWSACVQAVKTKWVPQFKNKYRE